MADQKLALVVDSSVWIDFFRGADAPHVKLLERAIHSQHILIPTLVLFEILRGVSSDRIADNFERDLSVFESLEIDEFELAISSASHYRTLRSRGFTIRSSIDMLIGTWCIENHIPLLHNDRDFDVMEQQLGLQVWRGAAA